MTSSMRWRTLLVILVVALAAWKASYTFRFFSISNDEKEQMSEEALASLESQSLRLGLDLQGGMHLVLEVDKEGLPRDEARDAMDRALEVISNRIDQFGVSEPSIQQEGSDRIIVQLPGLKDEQRAKRLIGRTALLEFVAVVPPEESDVVFRAIDQALVGVMEEAGELPPESESDLPLSETEQLERERPLSARAVYYGNLPLFRVEDMEWVDEQLARLDLSEVLPSREDEPGVPRVRLRWGSEDRDFGEGEVYRPLYVLEADPIMTGSAVVDADVRPGLDPDRPNTPGVSLQLTRQGGRVFAEHTGDHVGEYLAMVLDGKVQNAPVIQSRIPAGSRASITGDFTDEEARDLAIMLRAGKLPAPMKVVEERTVGPSLGRDSITLGIRAMLIGGLLVLVFMLVYYKAAGVVAVGALAANLLLIVALMAGLPVNPRPALTLPGLAGIILTIGMAVDANVLIFERIREELRNQKTIRAAIRDGYERAFMTIMDANVTTLIAAAVLLRFGTGPVKGFAVTLSLGILASMFTAIVATRVVFDLVTIKWNVRHLSI
ncbi:MAG: protein translocase subunit SecD [Candidatus Eisenbacteria bacterium]|nr:protein translocase subunit SecD [Candidatus Eisenbacteria bacterium]